MEPYVMTISRMTIDKLGVKLYDRVSAVMAELVANSYDADARTVTIEAPMGAWLATTKRGVTSDNGYKIIVRDDGVGMAPEVVNDFYLKVGGERRKDARRGNKSAVFGRHVMGRKGVGKLAPFGICGTIEVITAGGELIEDTDASGSIVKGYRTAHFVMRRDAIVTDTDEPYYPDPGEHDGTISAASGTTLILSQFIRRQVPGMPDFGRQLAQRFGIARADWKIVLMDSQQAPGTDGRDLEVAGFEVETLENTKIQFLSTAGEDALDTASVDASDAGRFQVLTPLGDRMDGASAGFTHATGKFYPVLGWIGLAKRAYRDELMVGVRIYCRGKIAAQTHLFNRPAGFTGEFVLRSYLIGELHADWLDEEEDLIQTDRRDILWSDELGQAFEAWGQGIVVRVAQQGREPVKKNTWETFQETGDVKNKIIASFPGEQWKSVRETTMKIARMFGERLRPEEAEDFERVADLVQLSLMLGPHVELDDRLQEAASEDVGPLQLVAKILHTARVAELSSYGLIADKRVKVIDRISDLKNDPDTLESALQSSIEEAPWLINPQWSPISADKTLTHLRSEFVKFYQDLHGATINLEPFSKTSKRPDFVLSSQDGKLQIIEIKRPEHRLENAEWERIQNYINSFEEFFNTPGHKDFLDLFHGFKITLVCDGLRLTGSQKRAFEGYLDDGMLEHVTWSAFLLRTKRTHEDFLTEADRQKQIALRQ